MPNKLIFIVDDELAARRLLEHKITRIWQYQARAFSSGEACLESLDEQPDLVLLDIMMPGFSGIETLKEVKRRYPDMPVIMLSAQGSVDIAVKTIKMGALDYFSKPIDYYRLEIAIRNALTLSNLTREVQQLRDNIEKRVHFENIISEDSTMLKVLDLVEKVKDSTISVLIEGESGTGKELIAQAIHFNGSRKNNPFVVVNCASIPKELMESEFFGYEKGAFTGAYRRKIGKFELAHTGTIFLDEIGDLALSLQAKLLRALETRQFERVGGNELLTSDVRIISATNLDLTKAIENFAFREDLFFRLAAFPIHIPPLRERKTDIFLLAEHFLKKYAEEQNKNVTALSKKTMRLMYNYPWPGNVRELQNAIERSVLIASGEVVQQEDLPLPVRAFSFDEETGGLALDSIFCDDATIAPMEKIKEAAVRHALKVTGGNVLLAAKKLKIGRSTMYDLIHKYKIDI